MTALPDWQTLTAAEKIAIIAPVWVNGASAGEIALLHFSNASRNAVIGVICRAKLQRPHRPKPTNVAKPKPRPTPKPRPMALTSAFSQIHDAEPPAQSALDMINSDRAPLAGTTPVTILQLPNRPGVLCRFPVTGGYCGVACGDQTYCPDHHRIAYRPAEQFRMPKESRR